MTRLPLLLATAGLIAAVVTFPAKADALGPADIEIGARAGSAVGPRGPLGFGIGGRAGVSILGLYAGIDVMDYLGATSACGSCSSPPGVTVMERWRALLYGSRSAIASNFLGSRFGPGSVWAIFAYRKRKAPPPSAP